MNELQDLRREFCVVIRTSCLLEKVSRRPKCFTLSSNNRHNSIQIFAMGFVKGEMCK
jgi:hypothetical protein